MKQMAAIFSSREPGGMRPFFRAACHAAVPLGFFMTMFAATYRLSGTHDTDEGINLMKALLVTKGYRLFRDIWSDQPPIFTLMLAGQFKAFGPSVEGGRLLVILLASVLLWSLYETVRRFEGACAAIAAAVLVIASANFIKLSCTVMIGLPAIAFGMVAVWTAVEAQRASALAASRWWLMGSAVAMALAIQTKGFALTLVPAIVTLMLLPKDEPVSKSLSFGPRFKSAQDWRQ